jgi:pilus assembly protein CpaE
VNQQIRTLIAAESDIRLDLVEAAIPSDGEIQVVGVMEGLEESWTALQETPSDLLVVACGDYFDRALVLIESARRQNPDRPVIAFYAGSPNGFLKRAFQAGADDVVTLPADADLTRFALQKAVARKQTMLTATAVASSPMITVLGPKGGTGKTLTVCNLSVGLALRGKRVAVVDLDLQFGDVGLSLGLSPDKTLYDLARSGGSLDAEKLEGFLASHSSGARVLIAPTRPDQAGVVTPAFLQELYPVLRTSFDYVLVDTPPGFTPEVIASVDSSTDVVMVGMLDSLSLKNTKLGLETLELMGFDKQRVTVLLNRADSKVGLTDDDVVSVIGRRPDVLVPSDREIPRSVNEGAPMIQAKPRSDAARAYGRLVEGYLQRGQEAQSGKRRMRFWRAG